MMYRVSRYYPGVLLRYFVTSRVRRELLRLLWADAAHGSVSEMARQARASFAAVHRELEAMRAANLAVCERVGNRLAYRSNEEHRQAALLRRLVREMPPETSALREREEGEVRSWLRAAGAPLGAPVTGGRLPPLEEALAAGLSLAHRDATVARVLPLVLWRQRDRLDLDKLARAATRRNERPALGCFLELAGRLGGDARLVTAANRLRDRRRHRAQLFFTRAQGPMAAAAARRNTPAVARKWGYLMNMGLDSFASAFAKHALTA